MINEEIYKEIYISHLFIISRRLESVYNCSNNLSMICILSMINSEVAFFFFG